MTVTVNLAAEGSLDTRCTVYNKGPPNPQTTRCNVKLLSAGAGVSRPRPFTQR